jgi:hypothetical protein
MRKKLAVVLLTIIAVSTLSLAISYASAHPWMGMYNSSGMMPFTSNRWIQKSWVRVDGMITKWGETNVTGHLSAFSRTALLNTDATRQLAQASAIWTANKSRPICAVRTVENFTNTFYSAKLWNASSVVLGNGDTNLFLNGTWSVYNVTSVVTIITNEDGEIIKIHRDQDIEVTKAYGELNVTDNWTKFEIVIEGLDPLTGSVFRSMTRQKQFNPFKVADDDVEGTAVETETEKVTRVDLVTIRRCYGAMPGWGNFDQKMDFNGNYKIDIADLTTVAANVQ